MDDRNYTFEDIEKYLSGELSPQEKNAFEEKMREEEQLAKEVALQKNTHKALDVYAQLKTKSKIREIFQEESQAAKGTNRTWLKIAAGLLVLIIGSVYAIALMNYSNESILADNFEPYPDRITTMAAGTNTPLTEAVAAYNAKDYERAISLFTQLPDSIEQQILVRLYTGIAYLETGDFSSAINTFQQLELTSDNFSEVARWYLALSYLKSGNIAESKSLLEQIVSEDTYQSTQAELILGKLDHTLRSLPGVE